MESFDRTNLDGADEYFLHCIRVGDVKNAMDCFDADAIYIDREGNVIAGLANIEAVIVILCKMKPDIQVYERKTAPVGKDMMYWLDKWTMFTKDVDGKNIQINGASANILRKNSDGIWLWLVDNPFAALFFTG